MTKKKIFSVTLDDSQVEWLETMSRLNNKTKGYFIRLGLEKLIELTGGYDG